MSATQLTSATPASTQPASFVVCATHADLGGRKSYLSAARPGTWTWNIARAARFSTQAAAQAAIPTWAPPADIVPA